MSASAYIDALEWRQKNGSLFEKAIVKPAIEEAAHERPILMQQLCEEIRRYDHVDAEGMPVKLNNSHVAIFARMLWSEHPEVRPWLHLRRSAWDDLFGISIGVDGKPHKTGNGGHGQC